MILVDALHSAPWLAMFRQWASGFGMELHIAGITDVESVRWSDYDLVIIGPSAASRSTSIIALVRRQNRSASVVVFSTRPDWREAREALLAGAVDYAPVPEDHRALSTTLEAALDRASFVGPSCKLEPGDSNETSTTDRGQ